MVVGIVYFRCKMVSSGAAVKLGQGTLRELRIHLCPTSAASAGVRNFIENGYVPLKKANRQFPILVRECSGIQPKIYARFVSLLCWVINVYRELKKLNGLKISP